MRLPDLDPREYQLPFLRAMDSGKRRALLIWHRRCGKDLVCWNYMIRQAFFHRVGVYNYFFPTSGLGKRVIWDGIDGRGRSFLSYIPEQILASKPNSQEMKIKLTNGSIIQIIGTDKIVNVGVNPVGAVFSEFSLQDPKAWTLIRPIFRENKGWAVFNGTPRGKNHLYDLYVNTKNNNRWFTQLLTVDDTGVVDEEGIQEEREEGMSEDMIQQEFYCSFDLGAEGTYYAKLVNKAYLDGRIGICPADPQAVTHTVWDIGVNDPGAVIFFQQAGREIHIIDCYSTVGEGLHHYADILQQKREKYGYIYGSHFVPHDMQVQEYGSGLTRIEMARNLGLEMVVLDRLSIAEGIVMARGIFPRVWIDEEKCKPFIKAIDNYRRKYNESYNVYSNTPLHDWSSHYADTLRYLAMAVQSGSSSPGMSPEEAYALERKYRNRFL